MFVLALPLHAGSDLFTIAAFVGGLSAATAMVIVESVALAIMVSNDIVMPLVLRRREDAHHRPRRCRRRCCCTVRRLRDLRDPAARLSCITASAGDAQLASIGLLSFAAIAQLAPAFFGGLIWRRATARGALAGMIDRDPDLGLYAAAAELCRRRHRRFRHPDRRAVGHRAAAAAGAVRPRPAAARPRRGVEPRAQHPRLCRVLARARAGLDRAAAGGSVRALRTSRRSRRASGCGAPR